MTSMVDEIVKNMMLVFLKASLNMAPNMEK